MSFLLLPIIPSFLDKVKNAKMANEMEMKSHTAIFKQSMHVLSPISLPALYLGHFISA